MCSIIELIGLNNTIYYDFEELLLLVNLKFDFIFSIYNDLIHIRDLVL